MPTAYEWNGDLFCEGDIVHTLTDHEPWSAWIDAGNEPGTDTAETQLNEIAAHFRVNRNNAGSVRRKNFPVRLTVLPDPPSFCRACLQFFSEPPEGTDVRTAEPEQGAQMIQSALTMHASALLSPETPEEQTLSTLFNELNTLADRYKDDAVMLSAVENLALVIIKLAGDGEAGRIDPSTLNKQVRDTVGRAGGDTDGL